MLDRYFGALIQMGDSLTVRILYLRERELKNKCRLLHISRSGLQAKADVRHFQAYRYHTTLYCLLRPPTQEVTLR